MVLECNPPQLNRRPSPKHPLISVQPAALLLRARCQSRCHASILAGSAYTRPSGLLNPLPACTSRPPRNLKIRDTSHCVTFNRTPVRGGLGDALWLPRPVHCPGTGGTARAAPASRRDFGSGGAGRPPYSTYARAPRQSCLDTQHLGAMDTLLAIAVEEVALEGRSGCAPATLWALLEERGVPAVEELRALLWRHLRAAPRQIQFTTAGLLTAGCGHFGVCMVDWEGPAAGQIARPPPPLRAPRTPAKRAAPLRARRPSLPPSPRGRAGAGSPAGGATRASPTGCSRMATTRRRAAGGKGCCEQAMGARRGGGLGPTTTAGAGAGSSSRSSSCSSCALECPKPRSWGAPASLPARCVQQAGHGAAAA
jgi:hypothetical protein